jgi:hypothetical protein
MRGTREDRKRMIRKLLRENEGGITFEKPPRGMSDYRRAYDEMEGVPASLSSPMMAGRPIGSRISELPSESLRKSVEGLVLGILDVIDRTIEERGISGAEVVARGITQGLQSRGLTMMESMQKQLDSFGSDADVTPEDREEAKKRVMDFYKEKGAKPPTGSDLDNSIKSQLGVMAGLKKKKAENEKNRVSEATLRRQIRAILREAPMDDQPIVAQGEQKDEKQQKGAQRVPKASSTTRSLLKKAFLMAAEEMKGRTDIPDEEKKAYEALMSLDNQKELDLAINTLANFAPAIAGGDPASVAPILQRASKTGAAASAVSRGEKKLSGMQQESRRRKR